MYVTKILHWEKLLTNTTNLGITLGMDRIEEYMKDNKFEPSNKLIELIAKAKKQNEKVDDAFERISDSINKKNTEYLNNNIRQQMFNYRQIMKELDNRKSKDDKQ